MKWYFFVFVIGIIIDINVGILIFLNFVDEI